jgi:DNA-binding beta-propeller fold protein YncE
MRVLLVEDDAMIGEAVRGAAGIVRRLLIAGWTSASLIAASQAAAQPAPIFVLNSLDASVSIIDPTAWKEVRRLSTGTEPHHLYLTPDRKSLIVANSRSDSLTFIDPRTAQVQRVVRGTLDP